MGKLLTLIKKDLTLEFRTKETVSVMVFLSLLLSVLAAFGLNSAFVPQMVIEKLFPVFLWFVFIVTAAVATGRTYEYELQNSALDGVILTGVSPSLIYLSKAISSMIIIFLGQAATIGVLSILLDISLTSWCGGLLVLSILVVLGYSSLSTLIAAMTSTSRLKNLLLPLLLLPLLFPLFFSAVELTFALQQHGSLPFESFWFSLLCGLDLVYLGLGITLYEYLIKD